jgi:hypothetical protein
MSTVLDDVTDERIDAGHIRRRVEDWEERLRDDADRGDDGD